MEKEDPKVVKKFDPNIAELTSLVKATKGIKATDLEDPQQLAIVRQNRITIKKARVKIEKAGLSARDEANKFAKAVIAYEKKLIGIIEPEEDRLAAIEQEAEDLAIRKERLEKLPARKERIEKAGLTEFCKLTDDDFLAMDANAFEQFFIDLGFAKLDHEKVVEQERQAEEVRKTAEENAKKEEAQRKKQEELDAKEKALDEEKRRIDHEKEVEQAKKDTEARLKKEQADREKEIAKAQKEEEARLVEAKKAEDARIAKEKKEYDAKMKKDKEYQDFLKGLGMTKTNMADFHKEETETEIIVYKKVGTFKLN